MGKLSFKIAANDRELKEAFGVRKGVFVEEQGKIAEAIADFEKIITITSDPQAINWARQQIEELSE